jgi:hypothetical protein
VGVIAPALKLFVEKFVVADKRKQMLDRLATKERRAETLEALPRWLQGLKAPLTGADQSPAGIEKRFGALQGVLLQVDGAERVTIRGAVEARRGLWIADHGRMALLMAGGELLLLQ